VPAVLVIAAYCYAELAVSSLAVTETIASTYCTYPRRNGRLGDWLNIEMVTVTILVLTGLNVEQLG